MGRKVGRKGTRRTPRGQPQANQHPKTTEWQDRELLCRKTCWIGGRANFSWVANRGELESGSSVPNAFVQGGGDHFEVGLGSRQDEHGVPSRNEQGQKGEGGRLVLCQEHCQSVRLPENSRPTNSQRREVRKEEASAAYM